MVRHIDQAALQPSGARLELVDDGREEALHADVVVDATGTRAFLGKHFSLTRQIEDLKATATWCYVTGAGGIGPPLERDIQLIVTVPEGWVWWLEGPGRSRDFSPLAPIF